MKLICDECAKEIKSDDPIIVADNYDFGDDWVFCSVKCFEEFNRIKKYAHASEYFGLSYFDEEK